MHHAPRSSTGGASRAAQRGRLSSTHGRQRSAPASAARGLNGRFVRSLCLGLLATLPCGCGTTAPWYRSSAPSVSRSDAARGEGSKTSGRSVLVEYDRFKDDTRVYTQPLYVVGDSASFLRPEGQSLAISLNAVLQGNRTRFRKGENPLLMLEFSSLAEDWQYLDSQSCIFLIDGKVRMDLGDGVRAGKMQSGYSVESLRFQIMREQAEALTKAATIEARLGGGEFSIAPAELKSFRELLDAVRAPADSG